jgi:3-dehydro-L-gulonate 2-dehydrogenase
MRAGHTIPMLRLPFDHIVAELTRVLIALEFAPERARQSAVLFTETQLDGVASHGLNRFPRFVRQVQAGVVDVHAVPELAATFGAWEQWDGRLGPGNLNATFATSRAIELAREHAVGVVALRNTNHWMRGGTYGWQAALDGFAFIGWTNTTPNMPPWGTVTRKLGNNPLIVAIPRDHAPVVLDMAMSQFSYGKMERLALLGEPLPLPGGYDANGHLTTDASAILETWRPLPTGYWKGAGLAMVLDLLAATLSGGLTTREIGAAGEEHALSQVFIAIDISRSAGPHAVSAVVSAVIDDLHSAVAAPDGSPARYPGESVLRIREDNRRLGVPVDEQVWEEIRSVGL